MSIKLLKWGHGVGLLIPAHAARSCGFKPGSFVRVLVLEDKIRVRHVSAPRLYDLETLDEHKERVAAERVLPKW
jgi:antitoxin component of MazEF toxin-antitoxin module